MPVTIKKVRTRLEKCLHDSNFPKRDQEKIAKILAKVGKGTTLAVWAAQSFKDVKISAQYFYAVKSLAESEKWIEVVQTEKWGKEARLTDLGKKMIEHLTWPRADRIEFTVDRGRRPGKISITLESKEIKNDVVKLRRLLLPFLRNYSVRSLIGQNLGEIVSTARTLDGKLTVSYEGIKEDPDVVRLLNKMFVFYFEICQPPEDETRGFSFRFVTPHLLDDPRVGHWSQRYCNYWERKKIEAIKEENEKWQKSAVYRRVTIFHGEKEHYKSVSAAYKKWEQSLEARLDVEKYVPRWLIEAVKKPVVKEWIERRLNENPNFFMPWMFWREFGFEEIIKKQDREKLESHKWSHPYDTILTYPKFGEFLPEVDNRFTLAKYCCEKGDTQEAFREIYYGVRDYYEREGFYDAWKLLREARWLKGLDAFKPIDTAFIREIGGRRINLADVYGDLSRGKKTISEVIADIEDGKYDQKT